MSDEMPSKSETFWYRDLRLAMLFSNGYKVSCLLIFFSYCISLSVIVQHIFYPKTPWALVE